MIDITKQKKSILFHSKQLYFSKAEMHIAFAPILKNYLKVWHIWNLVTLLFEYHILIPGNQSAYKHVEKSSWYTQFKWKWSPYIKVITWKPSSWTTQEDQGLNLDFHLSKMIKNAFYFTLKAPFILTKINTKFLS